MEHLKCKFCGHIFEADLKRCPECGAKVKRKEATEYYTGPLDLVTAATATSHPEKDLICAVLEEAGISHLLNFPEGGMGSSSLFGGQDAIIEIQVREADLAQAQALISELQQESEEIDWDSIDVGEPLDEDF